jgi:hypothetical protein
MSRKLKIWALLSAIIATSSVILLIAIGALSSKLGWLYFSGEGMTPSNYFIYYIEQSLGLIILASVISAVIWFITIMIDALKKELKGK